MSTPAPGMPSARGAKTLNPLLGPWRAWSGPSGGRAVTAIPRAVVSWWCGAAGPRGHHRAEVAQLSHRPGAPPPSRAAADPRACDVYGAADSRLYPWRRSRGRRRRLYSVYYLGTSIIHKDLQGPSVQVVAPCTAARATWPECILLYSIFQKSPRIVLVHSKINFGLSKLIVGICLILISSIYQV